MVLAAILPAVLYFCLFIQVDAFAARHGMPGMKAPSCRASPPPSGGLGLLLPVALSDYLMFWENYIPGKSALFRGRVLFLFARAHAPFADRTEVRRNFRSAPASLVPLFLICGRRRHRHRHV